MSPVVETNEQSEHLIRTKQLNAGVGVLHISVWITCDGLITKQ